MKYSTTTSILAEARTDCLIAGLSQSQRIASQQGAGRFFTAATTDFEDKAGKTLLVSLGTSSPIRRMLVIGGGIVGFEEADSAANVTAELVRRGYSDDEIGKIWGGNFLRVFAAASER